MLKIIYTFNGLRTSQTHTLFTTSIYGWCFSLIVFAEAYLCPIGTEGWSFNYCLIQIAQYSLVSYMNVKVIKHMQHRSSIQFKWTLISPLTGHNMCKSIFFKVVSIPSLGGVVVCKFHHWESPRLQDQPLQCDILLRKGWCIKYMIWYELDYTLGRQSGVYYS